MIFDLADRAGAGHVTLMAVVPLRPLALVSAVILAVVLTWAAVAKARDRPSTTKIFFDLGLPAPRLLAIAVPVAEALTAALLLTWPGWGGVSAFGILAVFTANLIAIVRSGSQAPCPCFGSTSNRPVSAGHIFRNVGLAVLALVAATFDGPSWG